MGYFPPQPPMVDNGGDPVENPVYAKVVGTFIDHFGGFEAEVLEAGMQSFVSEWTYRRWPVVGELMPFVKEAAKRLQPAIEGPKRKQPWEDETFTPMSDEQRERNCAALRELAAALKSGELDRDPEGVRRRCYAIRRGEADRSAA